MQFAPDTFEIVGDLPKILAIIRQCPQNILEKTIFNKQIASGMTEAIGLPLNAVVLLYCGTGPGSSQV